MKRAFLIVLLTSICGGVFAEKPAFDSRVAKRRVVFGIRGGVNFNSFGPDITKVWEAVDTPTQKSSVGWNIGGVFDCPIVESLYFQAGVFYKTRGFKLTESNHAYDRQIIGKPHYLMFPLLFSYRYNIKPGLQLELNLGPYVAIAVGGKVQDVVYSYLLPPGTEADDAEDGYHGINPDYIDTKHPKVTTLSFCGTNLEESFGAKKMDYGMCIGAGLTINRFYVGFQYDLGFTNLRNEVCWSHATRFRNGSATILLGFNLFK